MKKKISLIGAGQIGGTLAHLISLKELADVVLFDVAEGIAKGKALDISQSTAVDGHNVNLIGTNNYKDITFIFHDIDTWGKNINTIEYKTEKNIVKHYYGYKFALGGILLFIT